MIDIMLMLSAAVVMYRVISVITINIHDFDGHPLRFLGLAVHWMLMGSGAVAVWLEVSAGGTLLLVGMAIRCLSDRRAR
jgi:hypothetical protein